MKIENEPTSTDLMEVIRDLSIHIDERFDRVDERFLGVDGQFEGIDKRLNRIEALMVTKDYLDDKLGDFRGDMVGLVRREYDKTERMVGILEEDRLISTDRAAELRSFEVFPQAPRT